MCGIIGFLKTSDTFNKGESFVKAGRALMNSVESRGKDACGFVTSFNNKVYFQKYGFKASTLLKKKSKLIDTVLASAETFTFHTRFGTGGSSRKLINNHPHVSTDKRFMLVHNGVLDDDSAHLDTLQEHRLGECDTELLLKYLEVKSMTTNNSVSEILRDFMKHVSGDYAIVLYDTQDQKIFFFRHGRPLFLAQYETFVVFGSTLEIIDSFSKVYEADEKVKEFYEFDEDKVLSYSLKTKKFRHEGDIKEFATRVYRTTIFTDAKTSGGKDTWQFPSAGTVKKSKSSAYTI